MFEQSAQILLIAFGLGLLHALDADHILAVSALAANRNSISRSIRFAWRWAAGHGLMLLAIMLPWQLLGFTLPAEFNSMAEQLVGLVLITLGGLLIYQIRKQKLHLHFHTHAGMLPHAHWHQQSEHRVDAHRHEHKAYLIGGLHGLAGSAPFIALIPVSQSAPLSTAIFYLLVFSGGVFISMLCFGGVFGAALHKLAKLNQRYLLLTKWLIAMLSIGAGVHLVSA